MTEPIVKPDSLLLVAADGRRRGTATATSGKEQDRRHQVPAEEEGTHSEPGTGGLWTGCKWACGFIMGKWVLASQSFKLEGVFPFSFK